MPKMMHACLMHQIYCGSTRSVLWKYKIRDLYGGNTRSGICTVETQDLYSGKHKICDLYWGNTRSVFWTHTICILETQESWFLCVHKTKTWWTNHTSQKWLNVVHLLSPQIKYFAFPSRINFLMKFLINKIVLAQTLWTYKDYAQTFSYFFQHVVESPQLKNIYHLESGITIFYLQ